jgi:hypothetical protein
MNTAFYNELRNMTQRAYTSKEILPVPNFSEWWKWNSGSIQEEMIYSAKQGICTASYSLPPQWYYHLNECHKFLDSKFIDAFRFDIEVVTAGVNVNITLKITW